MNDSRQNFFYTGYTHFKDKGWLKEWGERGIGINLNDMRYANKPEYTFTINGITYSISKERARFWGYKFILPHGAMPNIIPIARMTIKMQQTKQLQSSLFS